MNGEDKVRLTVDIFGNTYKMVGSYNERYVKQLSGFVNEHMERIAKSNPRLDTQKVAILALVHVADVFFQLRDQCDKVEAERAQGKRHIEELRKAFELSQEKELAKSEECRRLEQRAASLEEDRSRLEQEVEMSGAAWAASLEEERRRLEQEIEMSSAAWADRVMEWEAKYEELRKERDELIQEVAVAQEVAAASLAAAASLEAREEEHAQKQEPNQVEAGQFEFDLSADNDDVLEEASEDELSLQDKYNRLQQEYVKLRNEFNEWIQLTQSEPH